MICKSNFMNSAPARNIVLLLTGTIQVKNMAFTQLTDPEIRKADYLRAIRYYLNRFPYPVVFVENTGTDLSNELTEEIQTKRLELLPYQGNDYDPALGKGFGEARSIIYGLENSRFISDESFIFKITGRYEISNAKAFFNEYERNQNLDLIADLTNNFHWSMSFIVGFRPFFIRKYLIPNALLINDTSGFAFENALAKSVLQAIADQVKFQLFRHYPRLLAISGTTGRYYRKAWWYMWPRYFKYWIRYLIVKR